MLSLFLTSDPHLLVKGWGYGRKGGRLMMIIGMATGAWMPAEAGGRRDNY